MLPLLGDRNVGVTSCLHIRQGNAPDTCRPQDGDGQEICHSGRRAQHSQGPGHTSWGTPPPSLLSPGNTGSDASYP